MKIVVTHSSPDMDAITSVWLIKKFLAGWENSVVKFVPAGDRINNNKNTKDAIEKIGDDEIIHVDTGLGPLDHHQTASDKVCGASLTFNFVKEHISKHNIEALERMVKVIVDIDHFKEVFRKDALADYHEFDLAAILDGLKLEFPGQDDLYVVEIIKSLDAVLHGFENRIWAEKEIKENGKKFETRFGEGMGFETINDSVVKLAQKMGYAIAVRKDPRKGYVRVKARPSQVKNEKLKIKNNDIDLTLVYEKLKKMDPQATWYLHISKKMLLNGSVKNPKMRPTKLGIDEIIRVLEQI